jgi:hypothetical protein
MNLKAFDPKELREGKPPRKPRACKMVLKIVRPKGEQMERVLRYERPLTRRIG